MSYEAIEKSISAHYGWSGLMERIEAELAGHGIDPQKVTVDQLAPVDNYHWGRLAGTLALARLAAITESDVVLDVGGGIGGPARQLAHRFGCRVTVLDLTPEYCAVGETLTRWTQLTARVSFVCANALAMPFPDARFDVVWSQHASMNIPDKDRLYREFARVLHPGGRLALYDVLAGPTQPIHFPVPWAADPSFSFLMSPEDARALAKEVGFREISWMIGDELDAGLEQFLDVEGDAGAAGPLDSRLLNGPDGPLMGTNMRRNSQEGRVVLAMGLFERV